MTTFYNRQMPPAQGFFDPTMPGPNIPAGVREFITRLTEQRRHEEKQKTGRVELEQEQQKIDISRGRAEDYGKYVELMGKRPQGKMSSLEEKIYYRRTVLGETPEEAVKNALGDTKQGVTAWQEYQKGRHKEADVRKEKEDWINDADDALGDIDRIIRDIKSPMSATELISYQLSGQPVPEFKIDPQQLRNYQAARDSIGRIKAKFRAGQATQHDKDTLRKIVSNIQAIGERGTFWQPEILRTGEKKPEPEKKIIGAMTAKKASQQFGSDLNVYAHQDGYNYVDTPSGRIIIIKK